PRLLGDLHRISKVISVTMRHEDGVELRERVRCGRGQGIPLEERVNEHPVRPVVDFPAVMAMVAKIEHAFFLLAYKVLMTAAPRRVNSTPAASGSFSRRTTI